MALQDFESVKILYQSKIYSLAVYHLQQAVEKYVKAYVLAFFGLSKKEMKGYVGHDSPKAFIRLLDRYKRSLELFLKSIQKIGGLDTQFLKISDEDIRKLVRIVNMSRKQIAEMDSNQIKGIINATIKIKIALENKEIKNQILGLLSKLKNEASEIKSSDPSEKFILEKLIDSVDRVLNNLETLLKLSSTFLVLYMLSIITYPHATFARYPNKTLPPEKYDENLGIVQYFNEIVKLLDEVANLLVYEI